MKKIKLYKNKYNIIPIRTIIEHLDYMENRFTYEPHEILFIVKDEEWLNTYLKIGNFQRFEDGENKITVVTCFETLTKDFSFKNYSCVLWDFIVPIDGENKPENLFKLTSNKKAVCGGFVWLG